MSETFLAICGDVLIEHADGSTECMDPACDLPAACHDVHLPCDALDPPCPCIPEEAWPPLALAVAA